jgi:sulfite reductase beta subunit-like hemoprotein
MPLSSVETLKLGSHQLRGTIPVALASDTSHFSEDEYQLLKFHGAYQQDDRDQRLERKKRGEDKAWSLMVRAKLPGGSLTSAQYRAMDDLAGSIGNGTLRLTTRQGIQFHGILKSHMKECIQRIHRTGMTTWGACGDVVRNTMAPASPLADAPHREAQALAKLLSDAFLPRSTAYTEIWLDGEKLHSTSPQTEVEEPIYGKQYLPRKFKIGIAIPPRNDVDVLTQDLGFIAHVERGHVAGWTLTVGGGFGMSHGQQQTFPVLGKPLFYIGTQDAAAAATAIVTVQRDFGNREDRKQSRLKYLIEKRGLDWFRSEVLARIPSVVTEPPRAWSFSTTGDLLGWNEQGDGHFFYGMWIPEGRIQDSIEPGGPKIRSALREAVTRLDCLLRITPNCNMTLYNITSDQRHALDDILKKHRITPPETLTEARRLSHACVSMPTCGLALAESERAFPGVMSEIDAILHDLALEKEPILIRMTGCPNGCARPYNADIAFVGRAPGKYALYVGGSRRGDRLAGLLHKNLEVQRIPAVLREIFSSFKNQRDQNEGFSEWAARTYPNIPQPHPEQFHLELAERAARMPGHKGCSPDS